MKIGFDAKRIFHNFSGLGNYGRTLVETLSLMEAENHHYLYSPTTREHPLLKFVQNENVHVRQSGGIYSMLPKSFWRSWGMVSEMNNDQLDLFHGLSAELPVKKLSCPSVVTIHDVIYLRYPHLFHPFDRKIYHQKTAAACQRATKIVAISQQTADDLIHFFGIPPSKIEVIYQSCDSIFRNPISTERKKYLAQKYGLPERFIVTVGTIEPRKNILNLVAALNTIKDDIQLVLVGRNTPYVDEIKYYLASSALENRVKFIHNADFKDFPTIYSLAMLSVYPSIFEGFGIPVIEAQSVGTPVVTSNISSMPEAGGDAALYIDRLDVNDIATKIENLLQDESKRQAMIIDGLKNVERFHPDVIAKQMLDFYYMIK